MGRYDSGAQLQSLLNLCGRLRCADAESTIAHIINERLENLPPEEEIKHRQTALTVLAVIPQGSVAATQTFKGFRI